MASRLSDAKLSLEPVMNNVSGLMRHHYAKTVLGNLNHMRWLCTRISDDINPLGPSDAYMRQYAYWFK